jgi:hypothetical protein
MRLTPKQKKELIQVSHWGHVFTVPYSMGFLTENGLVTTPAQGEIEAHYQGLALRLLDKKRQVVEAAGQEDFDAVERLARTCKVIKMEIRDRDEDQERLGVLSPAGIDMLEKLQPQEAAR